MDMVEAETWLDYSPPDTSTATGGSGKFNRHQRLGLVIFFDFFPKNDLN